MADVEKHIENEDLVITKENEKYGLKKNIKGYYFRRGEYVDWKDRFEEDIKTEFSETEEIIACKYDSIQNIHARYYLVGENGKYGLYLWSDKLLDPIYDNICVQDSDCILFDLVKANNKYGLYHYSTRVLDLKYDDIQLISTDDKSTYMIKADNKYGFVSVRGHLYLKPVYQEVEFIKMGCNHYVIARDAQNKTGLFYLGEKKWILEPQYETMEVHETESIFPSQRERSRECKIIIANGTQYGAFWFNTLLIEPNYPKGKIAGLLSKIYHIKLKKIF